MKLPRNMRFDNLDASESAFFLRQLEYIRAKTYDVKYVPLLARTFLPVDNSPGPGAETVTYYQYSGFGLARILANYSEKLPRSDVNGKPFSARVKGLGTSYGYSVQEIRAAMFAGVDLETRKANSARRAMEELIETISETGDAGTGLIGFLNQANAQTYTVPAGAGGITWALKTPDEIVSDMHGIANQIVVNTKQVEKPDTLLLPTDSFTLVSTKRMSSVNDTTILEYFLKSSPYIKEVAPWFALTNATLVPGTTHRRMVCYRRDPDALQLVIPQEFEQFAPERKGLEWITPCHARIAGVVAYYPMSMAYGDGI